MGLCSKLLLLTFLSISVIHGGAHCPSSYCGKSTLSIHYPFRLDNQISTTDCAYVNLTCNMTQSTTIVNLENSGDFYVQNIDYIERYIQLSDPGNCLTRRLMNFSLASSPFKAENVNNYAFYICPLDPQVLSHHVYPIGCLSNTTNITIATRQLPREFLEGTYGCRHIGTWQIPVTPDQLDYDGYYDEVFLFLTWDVVACKECEGSGDQKSDESGAKSLTKIVAMASSLPVLIITAFSCFSVFCLHLLRMIREKYEADSASAAAATSTTTPTPQTTMVTIMPLPSTTSNTGLDESKIMACTEIIVLSDSGETIPSGNNNTCSICLENYCEKETIRIISKCGHCFHATCIQQWLGKNSTCPVCRTSLSDVVL
ncbi:RING-H2 finger protein ATL20-like isoform X2 [Sesamum indicum]|nr:RING-H2 finger protein ATL20-like isoform X2 [Sesamum indicum]